MSLPTENPTAFFVGRSRGEEGGDGYLRRGVAALDPWVQFMQFCPKCEFEQIFVAAWQCEFGLLGVCLGCGDERIAGFSRVTGEVA